MTPFKMSAPIKRDKHCNSNVNSSSKPNLITEDTSQLAQKTNAELLDIKSSTGGRDRMFLLNDKDSQRQTFKVPTSSVLSKVKTFLPQMHAANQTLNEIIETEGHDRVNMEEVSDTSQTIQMELALVEGDWDDDSDSSLSDSSSSDAETSDSDKIDTLIVGETLNEKNIKMPSQACKNKKVNIEVLHDSKTGITDTPDPEIT